jgi:zinc transport system substrate-binding protein
LYPLQIMKRLSLLLVLSLLAACAPVEDEDVPVIAATTYPLAHVARRVAGDYMDVVQLVPEGVEPHDYEPSPRDIVAIEEASVLLVNGGIDAWVDDVAERREAAGDVVLRFFDIVEPLRIDEEHEEEHAEEGHEEREDAHDHGDADPHAWLDPMRMRELALALGETLKELDPVHASYYDANAGVYAVELETLDREFSEGLATKACPNRDIVVSHDAFGYLAARYGLTTHAIAGLSPEEEPSPRRMAELSRLIEERDITTVFFETLATPRLAQTIAAETGAKTAVLNPIEGISPEDEDSGVSYLSLMRQNLAALRSALRCR